MTSRSHANLSSIDSLTHRMSNLAAEYTAASLRERLSILDIDHLDKFGRVEEIINFPYTLLRANMFIEKVDLNYPQWDTYDKAHQQMSAFILNSVAAKPYTESIVSHEKRVCMMTNPLNTYMARFAINLNEYKERKKLYITGNMSLYGFSEMPEPRYKFVLAYKNQESVVKVMRLFILSFFSKLNEFLNK